MYRYISYIYLGSFQTIEILDFFLILLDKCVTDARDGLDWILISRGPIQVRDWDLILSTLGWARIGSSKNEFTCMVYLVLTCCPNSCAWPEPCIYVFMGGHVPLSTCASMSLPSFPDTTGNFLITLVKGPGFHEP